MRLFVAIELSENLRRGLVRLQRSLAEFDPVVRWAGAEQLHLTLKFLGEVPDADVPQVTAALATAAAGAAPMTLTTAPAGCFPPRGKVRVVWVGLAGGQALADCQRAVEDALANAGFPREERPFSPHLTLGRVREGRGDDRLRAGVAALRVPEAEQPVAALSLMQSELLPGGARHTRVAELRLGG